jgi:uncharacterized small protein (DUF1192 family)
MRAKPPPFKYVVRNRDGLAVMEYSGGVLEGMQLALHQLTDKQLGLLMNEIEKLAAKRREKEQPNEA